MRRADGSGTAYYLFDGCSVLLEGGSATLTAGLVANVFGMGGLLAQVDAGGARYAHADALGSIGAWSDAAGEIVAALRYEPFGGQEALGGKTWPYGFVGKHGVRDEGEAGLLLMGHRYYDPSLGQFLSHDPQAGQLDNG